MIEHLSAEQISHWLIGERQPETERHLAACDACRTELAQLQGALVQFRSAVREWSAASAPPEWRPAARAGWFSWPRLAVAAAALAVLISAPVYWTERRRERAAEAARADAQLLEQVDSEISRAVPEPMEPLVNLVTWNTGSGEQSTKVERR
jgi:hypothetical protein